jgi:hypothetical protein
MQTEIHRQEDGSIDALKFIAENPDEKKQLAEMLEDYEDSLGGCDSPTGTQEMYGKPLTVDEVNNAGFGVSTTTEPSASDPSQTENPSTDTGTESQPTEQSQSQTDGESSAPQSTTEAESQG